MTDRADGLFDAIGALSAAERLDVAAAARAAVSAVAKRITVDGALDLATLASAVEAQVFDAYVDGRVAGLCHDGALELFRDAADVAAHALCLAQPRHAGSDAPAPTASGETCGTDPVDRPWSVSPRRGVLRSARPTA